jgi:hypothetical protein
MQSLFLGLEKHWQVPARQAPMHCAGTEAEHAHPSGRPPSTRHGLVVVVTLAVVAGVIATQEQDGMG